MKLLSLTLLLTQLGLIVAGRGDKRRKADRPRVDQSHKYLKFEDCGM